jgi:hypothetical protein
VCGIEEIEAKWWMDGASKHIVDGRFQSALSLLRKAQQLCPTLKGLPELTAISQVCYAGSWRACSCSSRRELCQTPDWYRILEVSPFFPFLSIGVTIQERRRTVRRSLELERDKKNRSTCAQSC